MREIANKSFTITAERHSASFSTCVSWTFTKHLTANTKSYGCSGPYLLLCNVSKVNHYACILINILSYPFSSWNARAVVLRTY